MRKARAEDFAKSFEWFQRSADHGYAEAQFFLGSMYMHGEGIRKDEKRLWSGYRKCRSGT